LDVHQEVNAGLEVTLGRQSNLKLGTSENILLTEYIEGVRTINTQVSVVDRKAVSAVPNPAKEITIGRFRTSQYDRLITADIGIINKLTNNSIPVPMFLEAGPRKSLAFNPKTVKVAILTAGGIAPGLNRVIHAIVQRHCEVYELNPNQGGEVWGIRNGYKGLLSGDRADMFQLFRETTNGWLSLGGTQLGTIREYMTNKEGERKDPEASQVELANAAAKGIENAKLDILYVLGGDGSMRIAHLLSERLPQMAIACVPKTMDNDILWTWESFGYATAVEEATKTINTLHQEAVSTRRICIIELFGAESGFIAANAALASGQVDLVLIPEVFRFLTNDSNTALNPDACSQYLRECITHIQKKIGYYKEDPHAVVVVAEGITDILKQKNITVPDFQLNEGQEFPTICDQLKKSLSKFCTNKAGEPVEVFINQPRHNIRAVPANSRDQMYCERLGAMVVDSALAGYTDFMVSQWLTEFVLVPLEMATVGQKSIHLNGVFWKQVTNITGQPSHDNINP